mmetsp:Transcript_384/g.834  ORF Transcript_384/g.834 Transcript_384/m.834 type:complete len:531 (+) Transcript_384:441-2033(+)
MVLPLIITSAGMSEENASSEKSEESEVKVKVEEQESDQQTDTNENAAAPTVDLTAEIVENNADLTEQIVNAIALTNSISGLTPDATSGPLNFESLFPPPGGSASSSAQALGTAPLTAPTASVAAPIQGHELSLLSLLSATSNLLTPNEMALPLNDPSIFLPTPFAPGQNANTLFQQQQHHQHHMPAPHPSTPNAPLNASMPAVPQQELLQQLAAAYGVGGQPTAYGVGGQPIFHPTAAGGGPIPSSLMNGLNYPVGGNLNPMVGGLHLLSGIPAGLNPGIAGLSAGSNHPGIAPGVPAGLNHHGIAAGIPAGLNHPGMASFPNMGHLTSTITNSSTTTSSPPTSQANINTMASLPMQSSLVQEQLNMINAESSAGTKMPGDPGPQQNPDSLKNRTSSSSPVASDLLIKSRDARWIIRYNELLKFRREHGHCRVPHGYAPNRKLSWWVMNQRAQFAHRNQGKKTWLTDDRIQLLNDIGFIWTPHLKRSSGGKKKETSSPGEEDKKNEKEESKSKEDSKKKEDPPDVDKPSL